MGKRRHKQETKAERRLAKEQGAFNDQLDDVVTRGDYAYLAAEEDDLDQKRELRELHLDRNTNAPHHAKEPRVGPPRPQHCAKKAHADLSLEEQDLCIAVAQHYDVPFDLSMRMFKFVFAPYLKCHRALWPGRGKLSARHVFPRLRTSPHLRMEQVTHVFDTYLDPTWKSLPGTWVTKANSIAAGSKIRDRKGLSSWLALYLPLSARGEKACEEGLPPPIIEYGKETTPNNHHYHVHAYFIGGRTKDSRVRLNGMEVCPISTVGEHFTRLFLVEDLSLYDAPGLRYTRVLPSVQIGWVVGALRRPRVKLSLNGPNGEATGKDDVHWRWLLYREKLRLAATSFGCSQEELAICPACGFCFWYFQEVCVYMDPLGLYTNEPSPQHVRLVYPWCCGHCGAHARVQLNGANGEATNKDDVKTYADRVREKKEARNKQYRRPVPARADDGDMSVRSAGSSTRSDESIAPEGKYAEADDGLPGILNDAIRATNEGDLRHKAQVLSIAKRLAEWRLTHQHRDEEQDRQLAMAESEVLRKLRLMDHEAALREQSSKLDQDLRREMQKLEINSRERLNLRDQETRKIVATTDAEAKVATAAMSKDGTIGAAELGKAARLGAARLEQDGKVKAAEIDSVARVAVANVDKIGRVESAVHDRDARIEAARLQAEGNVRANIARNENPLAISLGHVLAMPENQQQAEAARVRTVMDTLEGKLDKERMFYHHFNPVLPRTLDGFSEYYPGCDHGLLAALPPHLRDRFTHPPDGCTALNTKELVNAYMASRESMKDGTICIPRWSYTSNHPCGSTKINFSEHGFSVLSFDPDGLILTTPKFHAHEGAPTVWPVKVDLNPEIAAMFTVPNVLAPVLLRATDARSLAQKMYGKIRNVFSSHDRSRHILEMGECDKVTAFMDSMAITRGDAHILDGYACLGMGREWFHAAAMKFQDFIAWGGYTHTRLVPVNPVFLDWYFNHYDQERDLASCVWHNYVNWKTTFAQVTSELLNITKGCLPFNCVYAHAVAITQAMVIRHFVSTQLAGKGGDAK